MTKEERTLKLNKFFLDPDWVLVEEMVKEYIEPLMDVTTVDLTQNADAVMAEVSGRKKAYEGMNNFLRNCRILGQTNQSKQSGFK